MNSNSFKTNLIKIDNSQCVKLPESLLALTGIDNDVEISVIDRSIVIRATPGPRAGWADHFAAMSDSDDDRLSEMPPLTKWELEYWEWE